MCCNFSLSISQNMYTMHEMNESNYYTMPIACMYCIGRMQRTFGISSGSFAGIGSHLICYKAKDKSGNESKQCCFYVYVNRK